MAPGLILSVTGLAMPHIDCVARHRPIPDYPIMSAADLARRRAMRRPANPVSTMTIDAGSGAGTAPKLLPISSLKVIVNPAGSVMTGSMNASAKAESEPPLPVMACTVSIRLINPSAGKLMLNVDDRTLGIELGHT